jgi:Zn-dependent M16 (insulinase) family peptidase
MKVTPKKITLSAREKKLPAWRRKDLIKKGQRFQQRVKATGEIEILRYKFIEKGFFEVQALTWSEKISFEGNMCGGLLKEFIKRVLKEGGKVERVRYNLVDSEAKEELGHAKAELKSLYAQAKKASKILKKAIE